MAGTAVSAQQTQQESALPAQMQGRSVPFLGVTANLPIWKLLHKKKPKPLPQQPTSSEVDTLAETTSLRNAEEVQTELTPIPSFYFRPDSSEALELNSESVVEQTITVASTLRGLSTSPDSPLGEMNAEGDFEGIMLDEVVVRAFRNNNGGYFSRFCWFSIMVDYSGQYYTMNPETGVRTNLAEEVCPECVADMHRKYDTKMAAAKTKIYSAMAIGCLVAAPGGTYIAVNEALIYLNFVPVIGPELVQGLAALGALVVSVDCFILAVTEYDAIEAEAKANLRLDMNACKGSCN